MKHTHHKNTILVSLITSALILGSIGAIAAEQSPTNQPKEEAKGLALDYFGITEKDVSKISAEYDDGGWEIEMKADGIRYECTVWENGIIREAEIKTQLVNLPQVTSFIEKCGYLTVDEAKQIALDAFHVTDDNTITDCVITLDDDEYEIAFTHNGIRNFCEMHASTGTVTEFFSKTAAPATASANANTAPASGTKLTKTEAKALALNHFGISADAKITNFHIERDDGVWEVEFRLNGTKYECELTDAKAVIKTKLKGALSGNAYLTAQKYATIDEATKTALTSLGITDTTGLRTEVEFDCGIYEFEWEGLNADYECDVNATTGEVIYAEKNGTCVAGGQHLAWVEDSKEGHHATKPQTSTTPTSPAASTPTASGQILTKEDALSRAMDALGITSSDYSKADIELDDGVWEIELEGYGMEYECEFDAKTGKLLKAKAEQDD